MVVIGHIGENNMDGEPASCYQGCHYETVFTRDSQFHRAKGEPSSHKEAWQNTKG